jgi:hypothetical protein
MEKIIVEVNGTKVAECKNEKEVEKEKEKLAKAGYVESEIKTVTKTVLLEEKK